jgi:hypothetical protein
MKMGEHHGFDVFIDWMVVFFGLSIIASIGAAGYYIFRMMGIL